MCVYVQHMGVYIVSMRSHFIFTLTLLHFSYRTTLTFPHEVLQASDLSQHTPAIAPPPTSPRALSGESGTDTEVQYGRCVYAAVASTQ